MQQLLIGRKNEIARLNKYVDSNQAEFVAIYGRRRVGKTFLVNNLFQSRLAFAMTGIIGGNRAAQLDSFAEAMDQYGGLAQRPADWHEAFRMLRRHLMTHIPSGKPCIVFIDELPCFDTPRSGFIDAFSLFWNSWASQQPEIKLIVCGSATAWMMTNLIDSHGGLHNRITHDMHLSEFTLHETEEYLHARGFNWSRNMVLQCYMAMGGVPYYLSLLDNDMSLAQNMDAMLFARNGGLQREFARLYKTLFDNSEPYIAIVEALFAKKKGMTRTEIGQAIKTDANGRLTRLLQNLVDCDLVRLYPTKGRTLSKRNGLYQLMDFFSMFYLQFMRGADNDEKWWSKNMHTPRVNTWRGLAFERVAMAHIDQIKHALGIDGITANYYSWRSSQAAGNAQIDIVIDRADKMVNVCEVKYSEQPYTIGKEEYGKYSSRIAAFASHSVGSRCGIVPTFITSSGLVRNSYAEELGVREITLDDLFWA
ncbi:MAG: AAA family ATPase [Muribaculaceae bacterium]|nr:AAA family ATPase [Muribaculaceae bacterium]